MAGGVAKSAPGRPTTQRHGLASHGITTGETSDGHLLFLATRGNIAAIKKQLCHQRIAEYVIHIFIYNGSYNGQIS